MGLDKSKKSNWVEGDTFAIKINKPGSEYHNRYLIMIRHDYKKDGNSNVYFRAKITENDKIPKSEAELNSLEYIKTSVLPYECRLLPIDSEKTLEQVLKDDAEKKYFLDEFNYLNEYRVCLYMKRGLPYDEFVYIGNFNLTPPIDEYISCNTWYYFLEKDEDYFVDELLKCYENYNLRQSDMYTKEGCKKCHEYWQQLVDVGYYGMAMLKEKFDK